MLQNDEERMDVTQGKENNWDFEFDLLTKDRKVHNSNFVELESPQRSSISADTDLFTGSTEYFMNSFIFLQFTRTGQATRCSRALLAPYL